MSSDRNNDLVWGNVRLPICPPRDPSHRYWSTLDGGKTWVQDSDELHDDKVESGYYQLEFTPEELIVLVDKWSTAVVLGGLMIPLRCVAPPIGETGGTVIGSHPNSCPGTDAVGISPNEGLFIGDPFVADLSDIFKGGRCRWEGFRFESRKLIIDDSRGELPNYPGMDETDFTEDDEMQRNGTAPSAAWAWTWGEEYQQGITMSEFRRKVWFNILDVGSGSSGDLSYFPFTIAQWEGGQNPVPLMKAGDHVEDIGSVFAGSGFEENTGELIYQKLNAEAPSGPTGDGYVVLTKLKIAVDRSDPNAPEYIIVDAETTDFVHEWEASFNISGDIEPEFYVVDRPLPNNDQASWIGFRRSNELELCGGISYDVDKGHGYLVRPSVLQSLIDDFNAGPTTDPTLQAFADGLADEVSWIRSVWLDLGKLPVIEVLGKGKDPGSEFDYNGPTFYAAFKADIPADDAGYPDVPTGNDIFNLLVEEFEYLDMRLEQDSEVYGEETIDLGSRFVDANNPWMYINWGGVDIYEETFGDWVFFKEASGGRPSGDYYFVPNTVYLASPNIDYNSYYEYVLDFNNLLYDADAQKYRIRFSAEWYVVSNYLVTILDAFYGSPTEPSGVQDVAVSIASSVGSMRELSLSEISALPYTQVTTSSGSETTTFRPFSDKANLDLPSSITSKEITVWKYYLKASSNPGNLENYSEDLMKGNSGDARLPFFAFQYADFVF